MKRLIGALVIALALCAPEARAACLGSTTPMFAFAHESLTVGVASGILTVATWNPSAFVKANYAIITTETNSIRFWADGATPTAAVGHLVPAGSTMEVCGIAALTNLKMIRVTADAPISVTYYRGE